MNRAIPLIQSLRDNPGQPRPLVELSRPGAIARAAQLKDPCAFHQIVSAAENPDYGVEAMMFAGFDVRLEDLAAFFQDPALEGDALAIEFARQVRAGRFSPVKIRHIPEQKFFDREEFFGWIKKTYGVLADMMCYAILFPPYYFVELTGRKWQ